MPKGSNQCQACGQFAGRGHHCPEPVDVPTDLTPDVPPVHVDEGEVSEEELDERIARAEREIARLKHEKVAKSIGVMSIDSPGVAPIAEFISTDLGTKLTEEDWRYLQLEAERNGLPIDSEPVTAWWVSQAVHRYARRRVGSWSEDAADAANGMDEYEPLFAKLDRGLELAATAKSPTPRSVISVLQVVNDTMQRTGMYPMQYVAHIRANRGR